MRAWLNQLTNVNKIIILPVSLIFVIFGIAITHPQTSQVQPIQPRLVSTYSTNRSGVELQQAYALPDPVDSYTGNNSQQSVNTATTIAASTGSAQMTHPASISSKPAAKALPVAKSQPANTTAVQSTPPTGKLSLVMNTMSPSISLQTSN